MGKKIAAFIIALLIIIFPFRRAFLSDKEPGLMMMVSFLVTIVGIVVFYILTMNNENDHQ